MIEDIKARAKAATPGPWLLGWNKGMTGPTVPSSPAFCGEWRGRDEDDVRHVCVVVRNEALGEELHSVVAAFPERAEGGDANADFVLHAREDIPYLLAQLKDREEKLEAEKAALEREICVVIAATPRGDTDAPFWRGRLGSLLFVRDRILKGGE